jgi:hypothetical protein
VNFQLSAKHGVSGQAAQWISLTEANFVRFKNGGKRLPSKSVKTVIDGGGGVSGRSRVNREKDLVREGDVGPYKRGEGHLYKSTLAPAVSAKPAHWSVGAPGTPDYYETDPAPHVQMRQNRDHQNNQLSLSMRGVNPSDGIAITIPQWVHMNGYTFGAKANKPKVVPQGGPQTRSGWIAHNPSAALFKEMYQELRFYSDAGLLSFEIVGSFRYLYALNVKQMGYQPTLQLDQLLMHYLAAAH